MDWRHFKYKRGQRLEITEEFGNGDMTTTIGYYWMNDATDKNIVLVSTFPPIKFKGKLWEKRFCTYKLIRKIVKLKENEE